MPNRNAYIRVSDLKKWELLRNKSQAIHDMLQGLPPEAFNEPEFDRAAYLAKESAERRAAAIATQEKVAPKVEAATNVPSALQSVLPSGTFVKADSLLVPPAKNLVPTEELPCCKEPSPCKHWTWDGLEQAYRNTISNRMKAAE